MKKILAITLCLVMFLGILPAMNLTGYALTEFTITPYENPASGISGFENWKGPNGMQTQLLICTEAFPQGIDHSIPWTITLYDTGTMDTQTFTRTPDSGSGHWLYRFELCTDEEGIVLELGVTYMVEARITVNGKEYVGAADGFRVIQPPIYPEDNENDNPLPTERTEITLTPLFTAWENWENSPNKGSESAVTQLLIGIKDRQGRVVDIPLDLDWALHIFPEDSHAGTTIHLSPATKALVYDGLYRFETCLGEGENKFVPEYGVNYEISISIKDKSGKEIYYSNLYSGFYCEIDPIVPDSTTPTLTSKSITLTPLFTAWENWENSPNKGNEDAVTQLLVGITDDFGNAVDIPFDADWTLTIEDLYGFTKKTLKLAPATKALVYDGLYRFETVLGDGNDRFIPENSGIYYVKIVAETDTTRYVSDLTGGFICNIDPIIPGSTPPVGGDVNLLDISGEFVNITLDGKNYFCLKLIIEPPKNVDCWPVSYDFACTVTIKDKNGKTYTLDADDYLYSIGEQAREQYFSLENVQGIQKGETYTVSLSIVDYLMEEIYESRESVQVTCKIDPPVNTEEETNEIKIAPVGDGFTNMEVDGIENTFLLVRVTDAAGNAMNLSKGYLYELTISEGGYYEEIVYLTPMDIQNGVYYFTPLLEELYWYIPTKGMSYTITLTIYDTFGEILHESKPTSGFKCNVEPIIPSDFGADWVITPMDPVWSLDSKGNLLLTVKIEDMDGNPVDNDVDLLWGAIVGIVDDEEFFEVFDLTVVSAADGIFVFKVETEGSFIPEKNVNYVVSVMASDENFEETHASGEVEGFITKTDLKKPSGSGTGTGTGDKENEGGDMFDGLFEDEKNKKEDKGMETWLVVTIAVSSAVLAAAIAVVICVIIMRKKKNHYVPQVVIDYSKLNNDD